MTKGLKEAPRPQRNPDAIPREGKGAQEAKKDMKAAQIQKMDEHAIPLEELCSRFSVNIETGLSS